MGEEFTLRVAESIRIAGTDLRLTLDRIVEDSRCPTGVNCVWEGDATVRVTLQIAQADPGTLDLHTDASNQREAASRGYRVRLITLAPWPREGTRISSDQYVATLVVLRST